MRSEIFLNGLIRLSRFLCLIWYPECTYRAGIYISKKAKMETDPSFFMGVIFVLFWIISTIINGSVVSLSRTIKTLFFRDVWLCLHLIETFKIMNSLTNVPYQRFFEKSTYLSTRHANSCKLVKPSCKKGLQCRSNFFSHRVLVYTQEGSLGA